MDLAKADKLYRDAMETTAGSGDAELADELLAYFIQVRVWITDSHSDDTLALVAC